MTKAWHKTEAYIYAIIFIKKKDKLSIGAKQLTNDEIISQLDQQTKIRTDRNIERTSVL